MDCLPFRSGAGYHVLIVDGSRIYDVDRETYDAASRARGAIPPECNITVSKRVPYIDSRPPMLPPLHALSLNVAQSCNLACTYCYADQGRFGAHPRLMDHATAMRAVSILLGEARTSGRAVLGFMGGEPLQNRKLVRSVTEQAVQEAYRRDVRLSLSLTTNATLLTEEDAEFFAKYRFTVAVSIDGGQDVNDRQRPDRKGDGSYHRARAGLERLLGVKGAHVSIRATVTPHSGPLKSILDDLLALGAAEVGFAPVVVSPDPQQAFTSADFAGFLDEMVACGMAAKQAVIARKRFPFSNFETGMHEISRGTHRPYPCSAGAGYGSVGADGGIYSCHRAIGHDAFRIGSLDSGLDSERRRTFLKERHVLAQEPCITCWARFLCGGGCHQEVLARGRPGCDYIRGWLQFLLSSYAELSEHCPEYFIDPEAHFARGSQRTTA